MSANGINPAKIKRVESPVSENLRMIVITPEGKMQSVPKNAILEGENNETITESQSANNITMLAEGNNDFVITASCIPKCTSIGPVVHGEPFQWSFLFNNTDHGTSFFTSVNGNSSTTNLDVNYPIVKSVLHFSINNDESTQAVGTSIGATVGVSTAQCNASRSVSSTGFRIFGNGTTWTANGPQANAFSVHSLVSGKTTLANTANTNSVDYREVQMTYVGNNNYRIKRFWSGLAGNAVAFQLVDNTTNAVVTTAPTSDDVVVVSNYGTYRTSINLYRWVLTGQFTNTFLENNNFWVHGMFELWMKAFSVTDTTSLLRWQEKSGVTTYKLYRDTQEDLSSKQLIYSGSLLEFKDSGLSSDTKYYYELEDQTNTEVTRFNIITK